MGKTQPVMLVAGKDRSPGHHGLLPGAAVLLQERSVPLYEERDPRSRLNIRTSVEYLVKPYALRMTGIRDTRSPRFGLALEYAGRHG